MSSKSIQSTANSVPSSFAARPFVPSLVSTAAHHAADIRDRSTIKVKSVNALVGLTSVAVS